MTRKDKLLISTFLLFSFLIFYPQYISNKIIAWLDMTYYFFPFRFIVAELVKSNILPLWNPYIYCGNPLMANMQSAVFYPLNVFFYIMPMDLALKITTFISFFLFAFFTYAFLRLHKISEEGSYIGAVSFVFTFYITAKAVELADFNVLLWMPAVLYFTRKYSFKKRIFDAIFLVGTLSMSFLGGHPQVFSCVYFIFFALFFYHQLFDSKDFRGSIKPFCLINALFLFIVLLQLLPTVEFMKLCNRITTGVDFLRSQQSFMELEHFILFIFPPATIFISKYTSFLNWVSLIELGILSILLFVLGTWKTTEKRYRNFLFVLFVFSFFISFLGNMPFYKWIYDTVPLLKMITYPSKINVLWFFITCMMVGYGYDILFQAKSVETKNFRILVYSAGFFIFVLYLICSVYERQILWYWKKLFDPLIKFQKLYEITENYEIFLRSFFIYMFMLSVSCFFVYLISAKGIKQQYIQIAVILFVIFNIFIYHWGGFEVYVDYKIFTTESKTINFLFKDKEMKFRRILAPGIKNRIEFETRGTDSESIFAYIFDTLTPNIGMANHLINVDGFDSLVISNFSMFKKNLARLDKPWDNDAFKILGAKYISSRSLINGKKIKFSFSTATNIYQYKNPADIIFFVPAVNSDILFTDNEKNIIDEMFNKPYNCFNKIFLNKEYEKYFKDVLNLKSSQGSDRTTVIKYNMVNVNTYSVFAKIKEPGFLICTDNYYPGWNVYVDGKKEKLLKADLTFKAVFLKAGEHFIKFIYEPINFYICAFVSVISLFILILFGLFYYKKDINYAN